VLNWPQKLPAKALYSLGIIGCLIIGSLIYGLSLPSIDLSIAYFSESKNFLHPRSYAAHSAMIRDHSFSIILVVVMVFVIKFWHKQDFFVFFH